jgi:hypothetical protein
MTNAELMTNDNDERKRLFLARRPWTFLRHSFFVIKKVPPPTPDRREGRLFPPEQSWKTSTVLNDLLAGSNKFYRKNSHMRQQREIVSEATCAGLPRGF